ncbi:MAG: hypothetical protein ACE5I7_12770, partial [Candidatus Binatia bacterium]
TANPPVPVARFVSTTCASPSLAGSVLTCDLKDIAPNSSATFHVIIGLDSSDAPGTQIVNSATVSDDARDLLAVSVIDVVKPVGGTEPTPTPTPAVQLQVSVGARNSTRRGRHLAFLIAVQNTGVATATNVMVSDSVPSVLRLFRVPRIRGLRRACSGNRPAGVFTCNLGDLPPGASKSFKVFTFVRFLRSGGPNTGDTIRNTVTATSAEGVMASGTSSTTVVGRSRSRR